MQQIQERACNAANRVDVAVGFVLGASITPETSQRILDAFRVTQDLLLNIAQSGQRDEFARFLGSERELVQRSDEQWEEFLGGQVKLWQAAQLNQKAIETLGDRLSKWEPRTDKVEEFDEALRQLDFIVTLEPEAQAKAWAESGPSPLSVRIRALSLVVAGIAIIASNNTTDGESKAFSGVSFGAALVVDGMADINGIHE